MNGNGHETHTSDLVVQGDQRLPESKAQWCAVHHEHYYTGHVRCALDTGELDQQEHNDA